MRSGFKVLDHTADIYIAAWAEDFHGLLTQAALAFNAQCIEGSAASGMPCETVIALSAPTEEALLFAWLRELLFHFETHFFIFDRFVYHRIPAQVPSDLSISYRIICTGLKIDQARHAICTEIKAVTRHGFQLQCGPDQYRMKFLLDV